jgi:hypothetical protein
MDRRRGKGQTRYRPQNCKATAANHEGHEVHKRILPARQFFVNFVCLVVKRLCGLP